MVEFVVKLMIIGTKRHSFSATNLFQYFILVLVQQVLSKITSTTVYPFGLPKSGVSFELLSLGGGGFLLPGLLLTVQSTGTFVQQTKPWIQFLKPSSEAQLCCLVKCFGQVIDLFILVKFCFFFFLLTHSIVGLQDELNI